MGSAKEPNADAAERLRAFIETAKALRTGSAAAEADFFKHLMTCERDESMWRLSGSRTYGDFLRAQKLITSEPFDRYKATVEAHGWDYVRRVGFLAASQGMRVPDDAVSNQTKEPARKAIEREMLDFTVRNRTPPSVQAAQSIVRRHYVPATAPKAALTESYDALRRERDALRVDLANALARVAELEAQAKKDSAEIVALRERLRSTQPTGVARDAKGSKKNGNGRPSARA